MTAITLHNDVVALRALEPTDLDILYTWENDPRVWTVSGTLTPYSRQMLCVISKPCDGPGRDEGKFSTKQILPLLSRTAAAAGIIGREGEYSITQTEFRRIKCLYIQSGLLR